MRPGKRQAPCRAKLFMANEVFFRDVLRIYLSELDKVQNPTSWDAKEWSSVSGMFVIILSAEISRWEGLGSWWKIRNFMVRRRLTRHFGSFTSKCGVLTHNVEKPMTRRASMSSFKNKSSESKNAHREKAGPVQSKTIYGTEALQTRRVQDLSVRIG